MKTTRLLLAAVAVALASACTSADITAPSLDQAQPSFDIQTRGGMGSGQGFEQERGGMGSGQGFEQQGGMGSGQG